MSDTAIAPPPTAEPGRRSRKMFPDARRSRPTRSYRRHKFTSEDYFEMAEAGLFWDQRVELLDGVVYDAPMQSSEKMAANSLASRLAFECYPDANEFNVLLQATLKLRWSSPAPDLAVMACPVGTPFDKQPVPLWVMEISDTTYLADRHKKLKIYAQNGVTDAWILNVKKRRLEVFRDPVKLAAPRKGWGYKTEIHLIEGQTVTPLNGPKIELAVADMLPPP